MILIRWSTLFGGVIAIGVIIRSLFFDFADVRHPAFIIMFAGYSTIAALKPALDAARIAPAADSQGRLFSVTWHDGTALLIVLMRADAEELLQAAEESLRAAKARARTSEAALAASDDRLRAAGAI